ncbi:MurT ligase domain-containing protein [Desulfosporosinus metallidurans]|uniref:Lipid II isoglutaminyl synthase (glutamine-hydrolyzing) subunit MurT n=1 Tax=Desulfosporosinus metallidurans TaxID=1888891 RepID=A0A1Q8QID2_9FIRM|nr:MurT ligase domain-containing protein [Desulfosporosinus metallidurans]OLN27076.1 putative amino acid ligase found clustered with an amidotransferase [Desulfosporosinus metallidurans]
MKRTWRFWVALWAGKLITMGLQVTGKKGTTLPGKIAHWLDPEIMRYLSAAYTDGIIMVTGTNGKTTTANLLASILRGAGKGFAFNQAGANLVTGITGALIQDARWSGSSRTSLALLEVDEATVPKFCEQVTPSLAIVTNFFRDQLDRYGELDTTVRMVRGAIPKETVLVLNADDPLVAQFGTDHGKSIYYGVERTPDSRSESQETREAKFCPICGTELEYSLFHYGQLGIFNCLGCGFHRPEPKILAQNVFPEEGSLHFRVGLTTFAIALQGYYNLYNALAALTAARQLGLNDSLIEKGLREFVPQAGRMERFYLSEGEITLTLVKNPTGFDQVIQTVLGADKPVRILIGINDLAADGRDISWLWDVNFERLGVQEERIHQVICTGLRAEDMALRLKYAGISEEKLVLEHTLTSALDLLQAQREENEVAFILPTYTLLFPLREILEDRQKKAGLSNVKANIRGEEAST